MDYFNFEKESFETNFTIEADSVPLKAKNISMNCGFSSSKLIKWN
jgi:hypothetical protein